MRGFDLEFRRELFLRTPLMSFAGYAPGRLAQVLGDPGFRLALYLGSPGFYRVLEGKGFCYRDLSEKEVLGLRKYYNRVCFRPTPFGLFSAFTLAAWGNEEQLVVEAGGAAKVHILPDQELAMIAGRSAGADLFGGIYSLNPTLYRLGREFRFIRSVREDGSTKLRYSLESLEVNALTAGLVERLLKMGLAAVELTGLVIRFTNCSAEEARDYVAFLREAGVVFSSLDANIVGTGYLERIDHPLEQIRHVPAHRLPGLEKEISEDLFSQGLPCPGKYFYANTEKKAVSGSVPFAYREQLTGALRALQQLSLPAAPLLLGRFIKDFGERFDQAKVPLLQAMDPDAGVGYGGLAEHAGSPGWLKEIHFPSKAEEDSPLSWSAVHRLLLEKWNLAGSTGLIRLEESELAALPVKTDNQLPPGMAVMFRVTEAGLLVESAGGVTGNALIGRFTAVSGEVEQLGREIALADQAANPGVVFAEIGQLSDHYTDNVNRRQRLYDREIPVNAVSLLPQDRQVQLRDLLVYVRDGEVILESARLKKRVVPRLSSAYNFHHNHLAVFRFLCDLQFQSVQADLSFDLAGFFPGMKHYPRVEYGGVILSPARWLISGEQAALTAAELRVKLDLPQWVALSRHDQQLMFDLNDPEQLAFLSDCTKGMPGYELREFLLPEQAGPVLDTGGCPLVNQLVAFLVNPGPVYQPLPVEQVTDIRVQRDFVPGSEWLYLKIYCDPHAANELLVRRLLPVIRQAVRDKHCSWFFIRYQDPGPHIRLRIRLPEARVGRVLQLLKDRFAGLVSGHLVREYRADTYRRELERYGSDLIGAVENFFRADSDLVAGFLDKNSRAGLETDRLAVSVLGLLLDMFLPDLPAQIGFLARVSAGFHAEFRGDKALRVELDQLYRDAGKELAAWLSDTGLYRELRLQKVYGRFRLAVRALVSEIQDFDAARRDCLLADLIHMHINRVYSDRQRQQEYVLYYCFHKYKRSQLAMSSRTVPDAELVQG